MAYEVYYDESGDLGWNLHNPFGNGGSSRYFIIGYMIVASENKKRISRFLRDFHKERGGKNQEIKGASIRNSRAVPLLQKAGLIRRPAAIWRDEGVSQTLTRQNAHLSFTRHYYPLAIMTARLLEPTEI